MTTDHVNGLHVTAHAVRIVNGSPQSVDTAAGGSPIQTLEYNAPDHRTAAIAHYLSHPHATHIFTEARGIVATFHAAQLNEEA